MGCCCPKEKTTNDPDETTRLLDSNDTNSKSRFVDQNNSNLQINQPRMGNKSGINGDSNGYNLNDDEMGKNNGSQLMEGTSLNFNNSNANNNSNENNHMFEKILNEVIPVSAYDSRIMGNGYQSSDQITNIHAVQEMPFKIKGLLEPQFYQQQQLGLPDGVPAPLTVLAAQPPFSNDIRFINTVALEASNCINNFILNVPDNVAFNFNT